MGKALASDLPFRGERTGRRSTSRLIPGIELLLLK
jgi:hypothetical protein